MTSHPKLKIINLLQYHLRSKQLLQHRMKLLIKRVILIQGQTLINLLLKCKMLRQTRLLLQRKHSQREQLKLKYHLHSLFK